MNSAAQLAAGLGRARRRRRSSTHFGAEPMLLEQGTRARASSRSARASAVVARRRAASHRSGTRSCSVHRRRASPRARRFDEGQRKLLAIVASRAAAAIENARLYEDLQATFQQTIQGLAQGHRQDGPLHVGSLDARRDLRRLPRVSSGCPPRRSRSCARARSCTTSAKSAAS